MEKLIKNQDTQIRHINNNLIKAFRKITKEYLNEFYEFVTNQNKNNFMMMREENQKLLSNKKIDLSVSTIIINNNTKNL